MQADPPSHGDDRPGRVEGGRPDRDTLDDTSILDSIDADQPLTWRQMSALFACIANRLDLDTPVVIVIGGGSSLAYFGVRKLTRDVDVVSDIPVGLANQIIRLAAEYKLPADWMNNRARAFLPADADTNEVVFARGPLTIRTVSANDLFLMKLDAGRPQDLEDLNGLWPRCTFESPEDAIAQFNERQPMQHSDGDPFLIDIVRRAAALDEPSDG